MWLAHPKGAHPHPNLEPDPDPHLTRSLSSCGSLSPKVLTLTLTLTPKVYARVGDLFRAGYGDHAGWAHSVLFAGELPQFRSRLPQARGDEKAA